MTLYQRKSFSVPSGPQGKQDCDGKHPFADKNGRCVRCGEKIRKDAYEVES